MSGKRGECEPGERLQNTGRLPLKLVADHFFFKVKNLSFAQNTELREAPLTLALFYLGIAQMASAPPPPALKRALWGTFFRADLSDFVKSLF